MLPETSGGEVFIRCPTAGLKLASFSTSFVRSTMPSVPNACNRVTRLRIQCYQLVARRDGEDPRLLPVGPIGDAAAVLPDPISTRAFVEAPYPKRLTCSRIGCHDGAAVSSGEVENAIDHQRRGFVLVFRLAAEIVAAPDPGDLQVPDVGCVDLIERRVPDVAASPPVRRHLAGRRASAVPLTASVASRARTANRARLPLKHRTSPYGFSLSCQLPLSPTYRGAGFDRYSFDCASLLSGVTLSGSIRIIR